MLALLAGVQPAAAQGAQFFRITGPTATTITKFRADGTMVWSNATRRATYTVQTVNALPSGTNWVDYSRLVAGNKVNTNLIFAFNPPAGMVVIPGGSFTMGNCMDASEGGSDELPLHTVSVSTFYMDKYDVTKAQWDDVYNWATNHGYSFDSGAAGKATNHPAQSMDWYDAVRWCNARSEKEGKTPAYYMNARFSVPYRAGQVAPYVNWSSGYRLPTEAEWEKAARGGASGLRFPWGNTISWSQANYYTPSVGYYAYDLNSTSGFDPTFINGLYPYTSPVGYFAPNGFGLYDMTGNVWQWCWDWYASGWYSNSLATLPDPRGPSSGMYHMLRGGGWDDDVPIACRTSFRYILIPTTKYFFIGFRSVLSTGQ